MDMESFAYRGDYRPHPDGVSFATQFEAEVSVCRTAGPRPKELEDMNKKNSTQKTFNDLSLDEAREWEDRFCDILVATYRDDKGNFVEKYETRMLVGPSESWAYFLDRNIDERESTVRKGGGSESASGRTRSDFL